MTLPTDTKTANLLLDQILGLVNADGIVTVSSELFSPPTLALKKKSPLSNYIDIL